MTDVPGPRDLTVRGLIQHLTDLVETFPEWAEFTVSFETEDGCTGCWNGKTFAFVDHRDLPLEILG
jgi:hypothetical protein